MFDHCLLDIHHLWSYIFTSDLVTDLSCLMQWCLVLMREITVIHSRLTGFPQLIPPVNAKDANITLASSQKGSSVTFTMQDKFIQGFDRPPVAPSCLFHVVPQFS